MSPKTAFPGRSAGAAGLSVSAVGNNPKNGRWRVARGGRKRPVPALVPPHREDSELQTLLRPPSTLRNAAGEKCGLAPPTPSPCGARLSLSNFCPKPSRFVSTLLPATPCDGSGIRPVSAAGSRDPHVILNLQTGRSSNGRTRAFGAWNGGSNPPRPARCNPYPFIRFRGLRRPSFRSSHAPEMRA